jgi:hypothetical protein
MSDVFAAPNAIYHLVQDGLDAHPQFIAAARTLYAPNITWLRRAAVFNGRDGKW